MKFWDKVDIREKDECWEWQGCKFPQGYGHIHQLFNNKSVIYAHRYAWLITYGEIPDDKQINHTCDNPSCCNPNHLYMGTQMDNMKDRDERNQYFNNPKPQLFTRRKLNVNNVRDIRTLYSNGEATLKELSKKYNINYVTVSKIVNRKSWSWLY